MNRTDRAVIAGLVLVLAFSAIAIGGGSISWLSSSKDS